MRVLIKDCYNNRYCIEQISCPDLAQGVSSIPQNGPTKLKLDHTPPYSDDEEYIGNTKAKRLTASTPIHKGTTTKHKGVIFNINEIIHHPGAFTAPATDIIASTQSTRSSSIKLLLDMCLAKVAKYGTTSPAVSARR